MSSNQCLWNHIIFIFQTQVMAFDPQGVFEFPSKWISFKMITNGNFSEKVWRSCDLVKVQLTFDCPKLETLASWTFLSYSWWVMIKALSNDEYSIKMMKLTKILDFHLQNDHFALMVDCWPIRVYEWPNWLCEPWNLAWRCLRTCMRP